MPAHSREANAVAMPPCTAGLTASTPMTPTQCIPE